MSSNVVGIKCSTRARIVRMEVSSAEEVVGLAGLEEGEEDTVVDEMPSNKLHKQSISEAIVP